MEGLALHNSIVVISGIVAPVLFQFLVKNVKKELARFWIVIVLSIAVAILSMILSGQINLLDYNTYLAIFTLSSIAWKTIWKPLFIKDWTTSN